MHPFDTPHKSGYGHSKPLRLLLALALFAALFHIPHSTFRTAVAHAQDQPASATWLAPRGGKPFFVIGANYEGPTDRAWMMWDDDKFDANLISADFAKARSLGINTLRIFVQTSLRDNINAGDFSKLDAVTALARQNGLWL